MSGLRKKPKKKVNVLKGSKTCSNCGEDISKGGHFVPPCFGDPGIWICESVGEKMNKTMRGVGTQMSNVLYNLFQNPGTITVDKHRVKMVQNLVKEWDKVVADYFGDKRDSP